MQLYEQKIEDALTYLCRPDILHPTGDRPICYVNYDVEDAMVVNRMVGSHLIPKAHYYGFTDTKVVSLANELRNYIDKHDYYDLWCNDEIQEDELYNSIRNEVLENKVLPNRILDIQDEMSKLEHPLLVMKDLEFIHPFDKIGRVEQVIYNQIEIPMLVLYPGRVQGANARTFLNIYPMDGSYRSENF
jgi:hypothetical protein